MKYRELIDKAIEAKEKAYAPYSNFHVGAAVLFEDGKIFTGSNIENASYGATNCAERTAIFTAVHEGYDKIEAVAVKGSDSDYTYPCGICRQVIAEFAGPETDIILVKDKENYEIKKLREILPGAFTKVALDKK